jgi:drug/metabolite transporter (DMT)-like permease
VGLILSVTGEPDADASSAAVNRDVPTLHGDAILLASGFLLGVKFVYTKAATRRVEPGKLIFWHDVFGVVLFAAWSVAFEHTTASQFTWPAVLSLLYQGLIVAGFCFAAQAHLLRRHSASQLSVFSFATPLFGIAVSVAFRGDPVSPWLFAAGMCVAAGILIVTRPLPERRED